MRCLLFLSFLFVIPRAFSQSYVLPDGDYMDTTRSGDTSCKDINLYYYEAGAKYPEASSTILTEVKAFCTQAHERYSGNGYVTFRFMIDCAGQKMKRTQVLQADTAYKTCHFNKGLVTELYRFLATMHGWKTVKGPDGKAYPYKVFITFKIEDGKVTAVIP